GAGTDHERERAHEGVADDALARMLANAGRDVHGRIGVVHAMVAPEARHSVHGDVAGVEGKVEHEDRDHARHERWQRNQAEQAEPSRLEREERHQERGVHDRVGGEGEEGESQIRTDVEAPPSAPDVQGHRCLDQRDEGHGDENSADRRKGWRKRLFDHCITSWSGTSFTGSRTTRIATMRPPRVSTWTEANTAWPALGMVASTAGSPFRRTTRHATGTGTRRARLAKRRRRARAPNVGRFAT